LAKHFEAFPSVAVHAVPAGLPMSEGQTLEEPEQTS